MSALTTPHRTNLLEPKKKKEKETILIPKDTGAAKLNNFSNTPPQPLKTSMPSLSKNEIKLLLQK